MMGKDDLPCKHGRPWLGGAFCSLKGHACQASFPDVTLPQSMAGCYEIPEEDVCRPE